MISRACDGRSLNAKFLPKNQHAQNSTMTTTDGLSLVVRQRRSSGRESPDSSPVPSRATSRGRSTGSAVGQVEAGEFGTDTENNNEKDSLPKQKVKLANIFKAETRSGSRLIPSTAKPGSVAAQPGTSKPRFRPFAARMREFMQDVHRPKPEKTLQHPNDCYRPPAALLSRSEREVLAKEIAEKEAIACEDGVQAINRKKYESMASTVKDALFRRSPLVSNLSSSPGSPLKGPQTEA